MCLANPDIGPEGINGGALQEPLKGRVEEKQIAGSGQHHGEASPEKRERRRNFERSSVERCLATGGEII